jgi:hypothetical protein
MKGQINPLRCRDAALTGHTRIAQIAGWNSENRVWVVGSGRRRDHLRRPRRQAGVLRVDCPKCARTGHYSVRRAISMRGRDGTILDWLEVHRQLPGKRTATMSDQCHARHPNLPRPRRFVWPLSVTVTPPGPAPRQGGHRGYPLSRLNLADKRTT